MSAKAMKDLHADIDEQGQLILQITSLIYKINQAEIAEASISCTASAALVHVRRKYSQEPLIKMTLSLGSAWNDEFTKRMLRGRIDMIKTDLQNIFDEGMKPSGGAA